MKKAFTTAFAVLLIATTLAPSAQAQIFGSSVDASKDSEVLKNGMTAIAWDVFDNVRDPETTTVNTVVFSSNFTAASGVVLTLFNFPNFDNNGVANGVDGTAAVSTMSANYLQILTDNYFANDSSPDSTITFTHLTPNANYELQLFDGTNGTGPGEETVSDGSGHGILDFNQGASDASYIIETFRAPMSGTETISVAPTTGFAIIDAINLREVPEPSTYAMLLGGLAFLGFYLHRRAVSVR